MDFGPPSYYDCPSCKKPMREENLISYTSRGRNRYFSDGTSTGGPHFTNEFAMCPYCRATFFKYDLKINEDEYDYDKDDRRESINDPEWDDLLKALKKGVAKNWKEEKQIRIDLWQVYHPEKWEWHELPDNKAYKIWIENCKALIPLIKKTLKSKDSAEARNNNLVTLAELNRNIKKFDESLKILNELPSSWKWLTKQFVWKCKAKDALTFELIKKSEMELEKSEYASGEEFYERGCKYLNFNNPKKALSDFNKAESMDIPDWLRNGYINLQRGEIYLKYFNDYENAITDFSKAIKLTEKDDKRDLARAHYGRCQAYKNTGNLKGALIDIKNAIKNDHESFFCDEYFALRRDIYEVLGKTEEARLDNFKYELIKFSRLAEYKKLKKKDKPSFFCTESDYTLTTGRGNNRITLSFNGRDDKPADSEIFYSGGENALLRRNYYQFILLKNIPELMREELLKAGEITILESKKGNIKNEYKATVRSVWEKLDTFESILTNGYLFFTGIRARLYANNDKPIDKIIEIEEQNILICILAREEDYLQLERLIKKGLSVNENTPIWFKKICPTPLFYITWSSWNIMKDPVKMLKWLISNGADINKESSKMTPLGNQCYYDGNYEAMKALLENGADPNIDVFDKNYYRTKPLVMLSYIANYDSNPDISIKSKKMIEKNYTKEDISNMKKLETLMREYGAKEIDEEPKPPKRGKIKKGIKPKVTKEKLVHLWLGTFDSEENADKFGEKAEEIIDGLEWHYFDNETPLLDMLYVLPTDASIVLDACKNKYPELINVNVIFIVYRYEDENTDVEFMEANMSSPNLFYIGEFGFAEKDTDGQYDAWI